MSERDAVAQAEWVAPLAHCCFSIGSQYLLILTSRRAARLPARDAQSRGLTWTHCTLAIQELTPAQHYIMARPISYEKRLAFANNPLLTKLYNIIIEKKSNLCLAIYTDTLEKALELIEKVGPHVCMVKVLSEIYSDWDDIESPDKLISLKNKYNFLLYEGRELFDHCETNAKTYQAKYLKYADFISIDPDDSTIKAIEDIATDARELRGCIALCNLSYTDLNKTPEQKLKSVVRNQHECCGIIAQSLNISEDKNLVKCSPGVHIAKTTDGLNQNWQHPSKVIAQGADVLIVGRGIVASSTELDLLSRCEIYRQTCWQAYLDEPTKRRYEDRLAESTNPLLKKLFSIMIAKESNLCVAVNFDSMEKTINFIEKVGHMICMLKVQSDRYLDWDRQKSPQILNDKKKEYNFILFEDRKFYGRSDVIARVYRTKYLEYADLMTIDPEDLNFEALHGVTSEIDEPRSFLALCELTYRKSRTKEESLQIALRNKRTCCGFVGQSLTVPQDRDMIKLSEDFRHEEYLDKNYLYCNKICEELDQGLDVVVIQVDNEKYFSGDSDLKNLSHNLWNNYLNAIGNT